MKKIFFAICLFAGMALAAQPITTPQPSPTQTIRQNFGIGNIELSYSRPGVKGRKIFGDLVPYGKVWRTGANSATTIQFSDDVTIGGKEIKAGKYGLLTIPSAGDWTVIITKDLNVNSPALYKPENDMVRVMAKPVQMPQKTETFTIQFADVSSGSCQLEMLWDNTLVQLPVVTNTDAKVMAQIDQIFNKDTKPYYAAATYYYESGKDMAKAREWVDRALADPANASAYYMYLLKARIHEKMGDKAGAKMASQKTIALATEAKNDDYVKLATELMNKL